MRELLGLDTVSLSLRDSELSVHAGRGSDFPAATPPGTAATHGAATSPDPPTSDARQVFEREAGKNTGALVRIPIEVRGEPAGFILASPRRSLEPERIDLLKKIGDTIAEQIARDRRHAASAQTAGSASAHIRQQLAIVSQISTLTGIDAAIQPLLAKIAGLLASDSAALVVPDPVRPRLFTSDPEFGVLSDDELLKLVAVPTVRLALNSGQPQSGLRLYTARQASPRSTLLAIPLVAREESIGVLVFERANLRRFTFAERELAAIIGRHLSFGLEREHRVRAHSRQNLLLSLVERVTAFIARSTDADDLLALMTREIRRTFGYDCSIGMISGNRLIIGAIDLGEYDQAPGWVRKGIPLDAGIMGRVARTGEPAFIRDVRTDPDFIDTERNTVSEIALPIRIGDQVVGVLNVESDGNNPLHNLDYEILHILANHIGIALSNRQLIASERETRVAMEAIQHVSTIVAETLDPEESLRRIASTLGESLGYPIVSLALLEGRLLVLRANYGYEPDEFPRVMSVNDGISGRVARTGQPVLLKDVSTDLEYVRERPDMTSEVCVPIRCNGEIVGILNVEGTRERPVTERDLRLLTTFAEHAGVLLHNARTFAALSREATLDPMTGVPNLRYFQQELQTQIERARRDDLPLSLAVIDLDDLKEVNDSHGHLTGDQVLRDLAARMLGQLRGEDLLARYAGDEFVAVLPGVNEEQALAVCARLLSAARQEPFELENGAQIELSLSIGVATYPHDAESSVELLRAADMAMYVAKESGKNRASNARQAAQLRQSSAS
jgi:diguanylate cyclase (GGDEF)-like protein